MEHLSRLQIELRDARSELVERAERHSAEMGALESRLTEVEVRPASLAPVPS